MLETTITLLAITCAASVSVMSLIRWRNTVGFTAAVYLVFAVFAGLVALLNLSALLASDESFIRTATLAYLSFATAVVLPATRALSRLTYHEPDETAQTSASKDAAV